MKRTLPAILLSILILFSLGFVPGSQQDLGLIPSEKTFARLWAFSANLSAQGLVDEVNKLRAENDLPAYEINTTLMELAQTHADYIASNGVLTHFDASGRPPFQRALDSGYAVGGNLISGGDFAENIHSGKTLSPEGVVIFWMGDPQQKDAMLSPVFQDIGVGMAEVDDVVYYVLNVGSESDSLSVTSTPTRPSSEIVISTAGAFGTKEVVVYLSTPSENGEIFHVVQKGEALWSIALAYKTTIEQVKLLNGLASDEIFAGQTLLVFKPATPTATPTIELTATLGIPSSTPTRPLTSTPTATLTPIPQAPTSLENGGLAVGIILLVALLGAGIGAFLGRKRNKPTE